MRETDRVLFVGYNATDDEVAEVMRAYPRYRVERVDMMKPAYPKTSRNVHWRDNLIKNGVKV
jgi:hypothetical protein